MLCWRTTKEEYRHSRPSAWGNFSASRAESTRLMTMCGAWSGASWVLKNLSWQTSGDGIWRGLATSWDNHHARHRRGKTQTVETTKEPVRQRQGLDGDDLRRTSASSAFRSPRRLRKSRDWVSECLFFFFLLLQCFFLLLLLFLGGWGVGGGKCCRGGGLIVRLLFALWGQGVGGQDVG